MNAHDISETDRETLSALFDGELQGDARRFASRRLAHDTAWQDDCGRWQLMGDAMRRQAPMVAPAGFAARVERAVAAEAAIAPHAPVVAPMSPRRPVRLWAGGALAASLALLAVFATRTPVPVAPDPQPTVAAASVTTQTPTIAAVTPEAERPARTADTAPVPRAAAPAERIAVVDRTPSRTVTSPRRADPAPAVAVPARDARAVLASSSFTPPDAANPFHVPAADPLATRPWPRAGLSAGGALTASYGAQAGSRGDAPSFYPFEPRTHADAEVRAEAP